MNRVIIDVFPTPWSPRKTNLYFARGEIFGAAVDAGGWESPLAVADVDAIVEYFCWTNKFDRQNHCPKILQKNG